MKPALGYDNGDLAPTKLTNMQSTLSQLRFLDESVRNIRDINPGAPVENAGEVGHRVLSLSLCVISLYRLGVLL
jgi:hypothetical protein